MHLGCFLRDQFWPFECHRPQFYERSATFRWRTKVARERPDSQFIFCRPLPQMHGWPVWSQPCPGDDQPYRSPYEPQPKQSPRDVSSHHAPAVFSHSLISCCSCHASPRPNTPQRYRPKSASQTIRSSSNASSRRHARSEWTKTRKRSTGRLKRSRHRKRHNPHLILPLLVSPSFVATAIIISLVRLIAVHASPLSYLSRR